MSAILNQDPPPISQLLVARCCFQLFDLTQVRGTVSRHPFQQVGNGYLPLRFRVKGRLGKIGNL